MGPLRSEEQASASQIYVEGRLLSSYTFCKEQLKAAGTCSGLQYSLNGPDILCAAFHKGLADKPHPHALCLWQLPKYASPNVRWQGQGRSCSHFCMAGAVCQVLSASDTLS